MAGRNLEIALHLKGAAKRRHVLGRSDASGPPPMSWKAARFLSGNGKQSAALAADRRHAAHGQFAIFLPIANLLMLNDYSNSFHGEDGKGALHSL